MRNLLIVIACGLTLLTGGLFISAAETETSDPQAVDTDSFLEVISYFFKNDSVTYVINKSDWRINGTDTTRVSSLSMTSQFVVTDSTAKGYKIKYTILDITGDSISESPIAAFQNKITLKLSKKLIGTTISFETNECGEIIKFNNLDKLKRKAESLFKTGIDELKQMPEMKVLKKRNVDISGILGNIDSDRLLDDYLKEITTIFQYHGTGYRIGEFEEHFDATDNQYEHIDWSNRYPDPENGRYHILFSRMHILPSDVMESLLSDFARSLKSNAANELHLNSSPQLIDGTLRDNTQIDYLSTGWPYTIVNQRIIEANDLQKIRQTTYTMIAYK